MALRPVPFAVDEWYHCYSRGVEKRTIFLDSHDYARFLHGLYLCNSSTPIHRSDFWKASSTDIFSSQRGSPLVSIGAYCLMPNHFHLLLQEIVEGGISAFMQKVGTAYSMYFNIKHEHTGVLLTKPFKSKHIKDDVYLRHLAQYIHLNPVELIELGWKRGNVKNMESLEKGLGQYQYSSFPDYYGSERLEKRILDKNVVRVISDGLPPISTVLKDAREYYRGLGE